MNKVIILLAATLLSFEVAAQEVEYRPGGKEHATVWDQFYKGNHEPELDDPLIEAGQKMTLVICKAIKNKDMRFRRYAIGALGYIHDRKAITTLESILKSDKEIFYFRGDALHAIYQIDKNLGKKYAKQYGNAHKYLSRLRKSIEKDESWLTEPTGH